MRQALRLRAPLWPRTPSRAGAAAAPRLHLNREGRAAAFGVRRLDQLCQPRAEVPFDLHAIDDHLQRSAILQHRDVDVFERDGLPVEIQTAKPLPPQRRQRLRDRIDEIGQIRLGYASVVSTPRFRGRRLLVLGRQFAGHRRPGHDRHFEADQEPRAFRQRAQPPRHDLRGLADHFLAALPAVGAPDPGVEEAKVIVNLRRRPDGRSRIADAVLLPDRDRRPIPSIESISGFSIRSRNCRAYADNDSTYRRCPSA